MAQAANYLQRRIQDAEKLNVKLNTFGQFESKDSSSAEWLDWEFQLMMVVEDLTLTATLEQFLDAQQANPDLNAAGHEVIRTKYIKLSSQMLSQLIGEPLKYARSARANRAHDILRVLRAEYGRESVVDKEKLHRDFTAQKWIPQNEQLTAFCSRQVDIALRIPDYIPAGVLENRMKSMILAAMPQHFASEVNRLRQNPPATWRDMMDQLNTFDKTN